MKIPQTGSITIKTKNSTYVYDADAGTMQGGKHFPEPVPFTFTHDEIVVGEVMRGVWGADKWFRSSPVESCE